MKIAVMSDVHGFSPALHDVLAHIEAHNVDQVVVAGDLCVGGPDPAGSIHLISHHNCAAVFGNTDRDLLDQENFPNGDLKWTRKQLSNEDLEWLGNLPFSMRIPHPSASSNGGEGQSDLLIVHANPTDVNRHLSPNAGDRELLEIIGEEPARTIAFGHLHVAYTRLVDHYELVDVSAVGNPKDQDLRPRYVVFDSEPGQADWSYEYHYIEYPLERTQTLMEQSGMPNWKKAWKKLNKASYSRDI